MTAGVLLVLGTWGQGEVFVWCPVGWCWCWDHGPVGRCLCTDWRGVVGAGALGGGGVDVSCRWIPFFRNDLILFVSIMI